MGVQKCSFADTIGCKPLKQAYLLVYVAFLGGFSRIPPTLKAGWILEFQAAVGFRTSSRIEAR